MPQLDKVTFYSQIFWLLIIFFSLHFVFLKTVLPKIASSLKYRNYIISSYTKVQQETFLERNKLINIQKDVFLIPTNKFLLYFSNSELDILMLANVTSSNFQNFLYVVNNSGVNTVFEKHWLNFSCRNELKII